MTKEQFLSIMTQDQGYITKFNECSIGIQQNTKRLIYQYNNTSPDDEEQRKAILKELLQSDNDKVFIEPPFHCDYGHT